MTQFSEKIKHIRKELGLSQEEFGSLFHVSRQAVSKWEAKQSIPDINTLALICTTLDISSDELLFEENEQQPNKHTDSIDLGKQFMLKRRYGLGIILIVIGFLSAFWIWLDIRVGSHFIQRFVTGLQDSPMMAILFGISILLVIIGLIVIYHTSTTASNN